MTTISGGSSGTALGSLSPEMALLALEASSNHAQRADAIGDIELGHEQVTRARAEIKEAHERARQAQEDTGFWGDVASVLGDDVAPVVTAVAAGATIVASGGSAAPLVIAAAAMTMGSQIGAQQGMDPKLVAALAIGGAALGLGATAASSAAVSAGQAAQASAEATRLQAISQALRGAEDVVDGAATASAAVAKHEADQNLAASLEAKADGVRAGITEKEGEDRSQQGIDRFGRLSRNAASTHGVVLQIQEARYAANQHVLSKIGGV